MWIALQEKNDLFHTIVPHITVFASIKRTINGFIAQLYIFVAFMVLQLEFISVVSR